jgi:pyridoxamine 5'-phosphate oxidase family protein
MSTFTDAEVDYLNKGLLGRFATLGADGMPHVTPLGVFYEDETETIVIGSHAGYDMSASKKFRDARRHPSVAVVVDDLASVDPWTPRYVEVRGHAETFTTGGEEAGKRVGAPFPFAPAWIRIRPWRVVAYGIETPDELVARNVT